MSPLACSLFALAALLATAHGYCTTKHVGDTSDTVVPYGPIYFQPPGVDVNLHENNCPPGMRVVGEDITTCNNNPADPAPHINGPYGPSWSYSATCSVYECPAGGYTNTKQYCEYHIPKNSASDV